MMTELVPEAFGQYLALHDCPPPADLPENWQPTRFFCVNCREEVDPAGVNWSPGVDQYRHRVWDSYSLRQATCGPCEALFINPLFEVRVA